MTPVNALEAARGLAASWPTQATISPTTGLPLCIETTRHVVDAFRSLGVRDARPLAVKLSAWNAEATRQMADGLTRPGAQRVELGPHTPPPGRGWNGHLVVDHPEFLLDLVLPGVFISCAARGFDHMPSLCAAKESELTDLDGDGSRLMALTEDGTMVCYQPLPRLASWRNTAAWRGGSEEWLLAEVRSRLERFGCPAESS